MDIFLGPVLGTMPDAKHIHMTFKDFVDGYVGPRREYEFARVGGRPSTAALRKLAKLLDGAVDCPGDALRR